MPGLLPILMLGSQLTLVADAVPAFDVSPGCRSATQASAMPNRDENSCKRDEDTARAKLQQDWAQYTPAQKNHCVQLSTLGGPAVWRGADMARRAGADPDMTAPAPFGPR